MSSFHICHSSLITITPSLSFYFFYCSADHRDLHSFPTRRSSDLGPDRLRRQARDQGFCQRGSESCRKWPHEGHSRLRSEEHTSELQSPYDLVCRLLLEKKKKN